ncbi:MAG: coproporphyrinogen dehydrogenase HemZ [Dethiobacter sp.]|jgi:oxygen-independent coproporphyrinogen-3 oxidase|nr:coproporphyrinogen dehydrogenase HemZ [Dethiobacter sp.]MBS3990356.1 coproporphyrinogen dehydrogenase HemZ [Dethiobacter sp.]
MEKLPWGRLRGVRPSKQLHRLLDIGLDYTEAFKRMQVNEGISSEKFKLLWQVARISRPIVEESSLPDLFSVYISIPFCPSRCHYCSFPAHSLKELAIWRSRYLDTLLYEIRTAGQLTEKLQLRPYSFYLGGGTPTSLSPAELDNILSALRLAFPGTVREFTVEAGRPDTITHEQLAILKKHGVTRVSVNPQSMHNETLKKIGRCHSVEEAYRAVKQVQSSAFPVLNMDLILGLPEEDEAMVRKSVHDVLSLSPTNITLHMFSRKRASLFSEEQARFHLPDKALAAAMYRTAVGLLSPTYHPYYLYRQHGILGDLENIGYCLPETECFYNIVMIEERQHILGLGCGATNKFIYKDLSLKNLVSPKDIQTYLEKAAELCRRREHELTKAKLTVRAQSEKY